MIAPSKFKIILLLTTFFTLQAVSYAQAQDYEWLKSPEYRSIFVYMDLNGYEFIADKLNETVKKTFSSSSINVTISNSMAFQTTGKKGNPVYELLDEELFSDNKIILHVYGKCIKYGSGFIYQFDIHFGVKDPKYSQALLYATPQHSVIGVDTAMSIESAFSGLIQKVVDEYLSANQQ